MKKLIISICFLSFSNILITAQETNVGLADTKITKFVSHLSAFDSIQGRESIFLHIEDENTLSPGAVVDFEIFLASFSNNPINGFSEVAYVELLGPQNEPMLLRTIKLINGRGQGSFIFPSQVYPGTYVLRAYTEWMRNFDSGLFFNQVIDLGSTNKDAFQITFSPEYGQLYYEEANNIFIKTSGLRSIGQKAYVRIFDSKENLIEELYTSENGIARLSNFDTKKYDGAYALLNSSNKKWKLPTGIELPIRLQITEGQNDVSILLVNKTDKSFNYYLAVESNDQLLHLKKYGLTSKEHLKMQLSKDKLREGINIIKILDDQMEVLGKKALHISLPSVNKALDSALSKAERYFNMYGSHMGVLTSDNIQRVPTKNFILTERWSTLDFSLINSNSYIQATHRKEKGLTISGKLSLLRRRKIKPSDELSLLVKSDPPRFYSSLVNPNGNFEFVDVDFTDETDLLFAFRDILSSEFQLTFDTLRLKNKFQNLEYLKSFSAPDSPDFTAIKELQFEEGATLLEEVVVTSKSKKPLTIYGRATKSIDLSDGIEQTNVIAQGGMLEYLRTRLGAARLLKDPLSGTINGIIISGITSINGTGNALLLYDGIPLSGEEFNALDPSTVGRIDVLRNNDAALFGSRGAAGVIIAFPPENFGGFNDKTKNVKLVDGYDLPQ